MPKSNVQNLPLPAPRIAAALLLLVALVVLVELRAIEYAYGRIGVGPRYLFLTLILTLLGSYVNIPLWRVPGGQGPVREDVGAFGVRWVVPALEHRPER